MTQGRIRAVLDGGVLLVESSAELIPAREFGWILRSLGERGRLAAVDAVLGARPPASSFDKPTAAERAAHRGEQCQAAIDTIARYNHGSVVCVGVPFGHPAPVAPALPPAGHGRWRPTHDLIRLR